MTELIVWFLIHQAILIVSAFILINAEKNRWPGDRYFKSFRKEVLLALLGIILKNICVLIINIRRL